MKRSKFFSKLEEKSNVVVFWNGAFIQPFGENRIDNRNEEYDIFRNTQIYFINTNLTTSSLDNDEKETVIDILKNVGLFDMKHTKGLNSARIRDVLYNLPKTTTKILNPLLPAIENVEDSYEKNC